MKNLILVATLIFGIGVLAQSTPKTPTTKTTSKSNTSYSISIHDDEGSHSSSSSVSVTISDDSYKFKASFHKLKTEKLKNIILDRLGKENIIVKKDTYLWNRIVNGDEVFGCRLSKGHLKIFLDKDEMSASFYNKIEALGKELKHAISGNSSKHQAKRDSDRAQRDLERAQRDLERAQRDLERAKRDLKRAKNN
jgi:hypothetical protein